MLEHGQSLGQRADANILSTGQTMQAKPRSLLTSTITIKIVMAATGLGLAGFVAGHMVGHLQMFLGRDAYNAYAEFLQNGTGKLLLVARISLLGILGAHVVSAAYLANLNRAARPQGYRVVKHRRASIFGRTMFWSGLVVLSFLVYHLLHFTVGAVHGAHYADLDPLGRRDVYNNFVLSFQNPAVLGAYIVANIALAGHLSHAMSSMFKTLGWSTGRFKALFERFGPAFATICLLGFLMPPLAAFTGLIGPEYDTADSLPATSNAADTAVDGAPVRP